MATFLKIENPRWRVNPDPATRPRMAATNTMFLLKEAAETAVRIGHPGYDSLYVACARRTGIRPGWWGPSLDERMDLLVFG